VDEAIFESVLAVVGFATVTPANKLEVVDNMKEVTIIIIFKLFIFN
jgi:hypothetical protein